MKEVVWPVDSDNGQHFDVKDIRAELQEKAEEARQYMLESIVETDDALMEKFFGGEEITKKNSKRIKKSYYRQYNSSSCLWNSVQK